MANPIPTTRRVASLSRLGGEEDVELHLEDTTRAGDGLVNEVAAAVLVEEGPLRVEELLQWGTHFDREDGELMLTREGAHSRSANSSRQRRRHRRRDRPLAAWRTPQTISNIELAEWMTCEDLILDGDSRCWIGAGYALGRTSDRPRTRHSARQRRRRARSTATPPTRPSPPETESQWPRAPVRPSLTWSFTSFIPPPSACPECRAFLLSEALRGEGAWLRNAKMERFMERYHPLLELAPRDVVARAITREGMGHRTGEILPVYLDMRHVTGLNLRRSISRNQRIPRDGYGLDLARDLIPVRPAAHYLMGGVKTDVHGRTSLKRLYAAGEVACTGVHGANRLASNSLLEGLVFGARAASEMREETALTGKHGSLPTESTKNHQISGTQKNSFGDLASAIQHTMWQKAGLLRDKEGLESALQDLEGHRIRNAGRGDSAGR